MDQALLVVDDEKAVRDVLGSLLSREGYSVTAAADGEEALEVLVDKGPRAFQYILCDIKMPRLDGLEFLRRANTMGCTAAIIVMSGYGTVETAVEALKLGAYDYISKPFKRDEVLITLRKAEERESLIRENRQLKQTLQREYQFDNFVAKSSPMKAILDLVRKVADYRSCVLVEGESGTGKELIARTIHYNSTRKEGAFVVANCAIPTELLEKDLFGAEEEDAHAGKDRRGLFEKAEGGTLFLDEVAELPPALQVKLLQVLQGGCVRRVGGGHDIPVDVRVVGATACNMEKVLEEGRFREDLYYRLNVIPIRVPPLRDRREDVPLLIEHFINFFRAQVGKDVRTVTPDAMDALLHYPWKGNVRELENAIERAVVLAEGPVIGMEHLVPWIQDDRRTAFLGVEAEEYSIKKVVPRIERELIRRALRKTRGNRTAASRLLEISHRALLYKIKDFGIEER